MEKNLELIDFKESVLSSNELNSIKGMNGTNDYCSESYSTDGGNDEQSYLYKDGELRCSKFKTFEC